MSISPSAMSARKSSPWRSMTNTSDEVKATLRPAARAVPIARRIAARGSSGFHK